MGKITVFDWSGKDGPLESNYWGGNHDFVFAKTIRILKTGKFFAFNCPCGCFVSAYANPRYGSHLGKFSSLPAKKPRKFETATGKENFEEGRINLLGL